MFLNSTARTPFENKTNGTSRNSFKAFTAPEPKPEHRPRGWCTKESNKKPEDSQYPRSTKDFMKSLKDLESEGLPTALLHFQKNLPQIPSNVHWQALMELADLAKRENKVESARRLLESAVNLQPGAHQPWLEYSKIEEESGNMSLARKLLILGIHFSPNSDQLVIKLIKTEERLGDISVSRKILGSLNASQVEKNWKVLLEGSMMEARVGNIELARHVIQNLIFHCSSFGAIYIEAVKFEEKWEKNLQFALDYCEKGLQRNQRYGPLWFTALRILEKMPDSLEIRKKQQNLIIEAEQFLTKELLWKLYLDYAIFLDKRNRLDDCKKYLIESAYAAPENLRWKVWVAGSRVELKAGNPDKALKLLNISLEEVPSKQRPLVLVEKSQMFELTQDFEKAKDLMAQACEQSKHDWKIYLERINLEMRLGCFQEGLKIAKEAVSKYSSTGRLWASLIQLFHTDKSAIKTGLHFKAFLLAIQEVPKSGEVWCEGGRLRLNPFTQYFDLTKAEEYLNYAIQFTPQYGDSFIEMLRVYLLMGKLEKIKELKKACINADPNYGMLWFYCKAASLEGPREVWRSAKKMIMNEVCRMKSVYETSGAKEEWVEFMWTGATEAIWSFVRNQTLDFTARAKLIYGSEGLIL